MMSSGMTLHLIPRTVLGWRVPLLGITSESTKSVPFVWSVMMSTEPRPSGRRLCSGRSVHPCILSFK